MKTITLTEEAYERLKAWKEGRDSFSAVVMRVVPKRGTGADMRAAFDAMDRLSPEQGRLLENVLRRGS